MPKTEISTNLIHLSQVLRPTSSFQLIHHSIYSNVLHSKKYSITIIYSILNWIEQECVWLSENLLISFYKLSAKDCWCSSRPHQLSILSRLSTQWAAKDRNWDPLSRGTEMKTKKPCDQWGLMNNWACVLRSETASERVGAEWERRASSRTHVSSAGAPPLVLGVLLSPAFSCRGVVNLMHVGASKHHRVGERWII